MKVKYINNCKTVLGYLTDGIVSDLSKNVCIGGSERYYSLKGELLVLNAWEIFCLLLFFVGMNFCTKKSNIHSLFATEIDKSPPTPIPPRDHLFNNGRKDEGE